MKYFIKDIVIYIYVEEILCPSDRELNNVIKDIVAYIYVEGALCLSDR
jgi:hypothetical protein